MARDYRCKDLDWKGDRLCLGSRSIITIERDGTYPAMWRVRKPTGTLTDMVNRARAKDAAYGYALAELNQYDARPSRRRAGAPKSAAPTSPPSPLEPETPSLTMEPERMEPDC